MHVIDASALAKLVLDERESPAFRAWYRDCVSHGERLFAPDLLPYELANTLWRRLSDPRALPEDATRDIVRDALIHVDLDHEAWARIGPWRGRLTAYDAAYLSLAAAKGATLVTYDERLAAVARAWVTVESPGRTTAGVGPPQPF